MYIFFHSDALPEGESEPITFSAGNTGDDTDERSKLIVRVNSTARQNMQGDPPKTPAEKVNRIFLIATLSEKTLI